MASRDESSDEYLRRILGPSELDGIREANHRLSFAITDYYQRLTERELPKRVVFALVSQMQFQLIQHALEEDK